MWFLEDGVVFKIQEPCGVQSPGSGGPEPIDPFNNLHPEFEPEMPPPRKSVVIKLNFDGCNKVELKGVGLLPHRSNFFYGKDPSNWYTKVVNYQELLYENIYENIDLRYYTTEKGLKYDFIVHPNGDPNNIKLSYEGVDEMYIDSNGNIILNTPLGSFIDSELFIYQDLNNNDNKIAGRFNLLDSMSYGFNIIGKYDNSRAIIIDPLVYSTYVGGSDYDSGQGIAIDSSDNAYVTGYTHSSNFPYTLGSYDTTYNLNCDVFVLKLNPIGSTLMYSTYIGGNDDDRGYGIALDSTGNVYVTGYTQSSNFPITAGANDTTYNGNGDVFVLKLNPAGTGSSDLMYSTYVGGSNNDHGLGIEIETTGNAYVTGRTKSSNFPTSSSAYDTTYNGGGSDVFVLKLDATGSSFIYSTFIGGSSSDPGHDIAIDSNGNAYVTGFTDSSDFPTTPGANDTTFNGGWDVFVLKLNPSGSSLSYSTFIGGSGDDFGNSIRIALDSTGNAYVTGYTTSSDFPTTPGANDTSYNGNWDGFVLKINLTSNNTSPFGMDLMISEPDVYRTNAIRLFSNATDIEDIEQYLTPHFEYRDSTKQVWNSTYFSTPQYNNSRFEVSFTPQKNAILGLYDFRVKFNDTVGLFSNWFYLNDSLSVLNNHPEIDDIYLSNNSALLGDSIWIWINATDIEELEENLTIELEYRDPSEVSWDKTYLSTPAYNNGRWECSFNIPFNASFGDYDFRARCCDSDGNYSAWLYLNDSLEVNNIGPNVFDMKLSKSSIYRTESIFLYINGTDYETPEGMLSFYIQSKPQSKDDWVDLTGNYLIDTWKVSFTTNKESILGYYDFRVKFEDNETASTGWTYINDSLEVLNNLPIISEDLDDISVGIQPLILDLTPYESDIEDTDIELFWSIDPQIYTYIESIGIIDIANDKLKITPKENVTGTEDIELILNDKDNGIAVKSDITINIDSTISEFTPRVTLLSPLDKAVINTLTPTLKWELDYSGTEIITYSVALDENPDPLTPIKTGLTTAEYTLENELMDGITYYWKVEPTNGICLSGAFRFTIDLGFEPIYKVNLSTERDSVSIIQGESGEINLTVTNEGNSIDNFEIEISSVNLQSQISVNKPNVQLDPDIDSLVKLSIDIPDDFTTGDYTITVTATSLTDLTIKDEVTIDVKVVSKDFVPDYDVSISISPTSLELEPGDTDNVTITISNNGNIEDDFTISFESDDFTSANIQFSESSLPIPEGDSDSITVTIKIPEDIEPGVYTVKFIVESNDDPQETTLTVTVKDKDGEKPKDDDEDNTMLYAIIGIIVIIIVVLILLFIFLKKKKGKEEELPVEEQTPQPQEEGPPEVPPQQPPTPEVQPEQVTVPETPAPEQPQVPEVPPEQQPTPEVTPQVPQPQVEPAPEPVPMPQVEEQPMPTPQVQPQVEAQEPAVEQPAEPQGQAPVPKINTPEENVEE
ncbi:MAG: SBBP repeat-containing protein [Thermoplasmata archaeon]|nr:SBBP repeat-containing protein [Thermoplasmata archaeon]